VNLARLSLAQLTIGVPNQYTSGTRTGFALDSAYVHSTSGDAIAIRYHCQSTNTIDALYLFVDDVAGSLSANPMQCDIYNENSGYQLRPGSTLRDSSTACTTPSGADKWVKFTFGSPYTPTVGEILWLVVYNTDAAPGTNYPTILVDTTLAAKVIIGAYLFGFSTTNGFSSDGSSKSEVPAVVVQGSVYVGQPFTQCNTTYYSSNTLERGIQFTPMVNVDVVGLMWASSTTTVTYGRILADSTAPAGTALYSYALGSDTNEVTDERAGGKFFDAPVTLTGGTTYKLTVTFAANYNGLQCNQIEDYSSYSAMFDALRAQDTFTWCWGVIDDGAGGWTIDKAIAPAVGLIISDFPAQASGGLLTHPGMGGGARG
jgi:hypothetical protein